MFKRIQWMVLAVGLAVISSGTPAQAADEGKIVDQATTSLHEIMTVPLKRIPESLLQDAEAVAVIPNVIKVGLVAGVQRGRGVVMIRDEQRNFGLPRFVSITGGSIGWQIGAQSTDFILVFKSKKSVSGLLQGKFTIGADAAAAAGPVGRRAEAATDLELKAEIYSYSRSRGLFAGVSLDGSVIQLEPAMEMAYYRPGPNGMPTPAPEGAVKLLESLIKYTVAADGPMIVEGAPLQPVDAGQRVELVRSELARSATVLNTIVDDSWKRYLALPAEVYEAGKSPAPETLGAVMQRFDSVARDPQYRKLHDRLEFRATLELLHEYSATLTEVGHGKLSLPPPPLTIPMQLQR
ncbi:lipid-binding SYLF domain-containing protein [Anatilimnocola sp. NA78]|uniref:lipid-binding SYLF domain-containing protein n=1 Tax=Anatilimnocola sp. NA78 TaxID=3415683 RepID=UPI003CE52D27